MKTRILRSLRFVPVGVYLGLCVWVAFGYGEMQLNGLEVEGFVLRFVHALWIIPFTIFVSIAAIMFAIPMLVMAFLTLVFQWLVSFFV